MVGIRGTRSLEIEPVAGSGCADVAIDDVANGEATQFAATPATTPNPPTVTGSVDISSSYFGSGVKVVTYRVSGSSITQIVGSIRARGPWSDWARARAEAVTRAVPKYRFSLVGAGSNCRIEVTARPAIPPANSASST